MIRILLADDHTIIRDGLKKILSTVPDMQVVAEAADGNELLALLRAGLPDVLLLDMSMPGRSGIVLIQQLQASYPALPVLVLSMYRESQYAVQAIRAGAAGYLSQQECRIGPADRRDPEGGARRHRGVGRDRRQADRAGAPAAGGLAACAADRARAAGVPDAGRRAGHQ
jgi:CheY-like chemotaxis protein